MRQELERETGIEPATFSLGRWLKIENKEHSEFRHLFQAIEFTGNSQVSATRLLMEFKWSSLYSSDAASSSSDNASISWPSDVAEHGRLDEKLEGSAVVGPG
jgi:hypothetical protein